MARPDHSNFYVTGGTLRQDAACYVERQADKDLLEGLLQGEFCYVLTSRQMGKSSLMVRTAGKLREQGVQVVVLDLTAIGQNLTPEQMWYDGLLVRLGRQLNLEDELEEFWESHRQLGTCQRFFMALREVVLGHGVPASAGQAFEKAGVSETTGARPAEAGTPNAAPKTAPLITDSLMTGRLVLFVDELDVVRSLPFSTDEFFAAIRECYNRRTEDAEFNRLTFCLLGVATPSDLIRDTRTTPFNIGQRIVLNDFTPEEAAPLAKGLVSPKSKVQSPKSPIETGADAKLETRNAELLLQRILYWTNGHPYLTQRLCRAVAERSSRHLSRDRGDEEAHSEKSAIRNPQSAISHSLVDELCAELFFSPRAREQDDNLLFVRERLLRGEVDLPALLHFYEQVVAGKAMPDDETNPLVSVLRLSGIARTEAGQLVERNRIYERVFDLAWVGANMPDAEVRRQRTAFRKGVIRATCVATLLLAMVTTLALFALKQSRLAQDQLYLSDMNLAQQAVETRDFGTAKDLLQRHRHKGRERLGWEWRYLWRKSRGDQVATLRGHSNRVWSVFFSGDSRRLASRSSDDVVLVWDLVTRRVVNMFSNINAIAGFTPDGTNLVAQRSDGWIGLCNALNGQFRPLFQETNQLVELLRDGQTILVAGGADQGQVPVLLRNLFTGRSDFSVPADLRPFIIDPLDRGPRISPDGGRLAVVGGRTNEFTPTGFVDVWEVSSSRHLERLHASVPFVETLGFGAGNRLAVGTVAGRVELWKPAWEPAAKRESIVLQAHETYVKACVFSPDGQVLATSGSDAMIKLWDSANGKLLETFEGHEGPVDSLTFSSDGKWLASGGRDATVRLWVPGQRRMQDRVSGPSAFATFTPSLDGRLLAAGFYNSSRGLAGAHVKVWEVGTLREVASLTNAGDTVMFSRDNQTLATLDDVFKTWNLATLKLERTFPGPPSGDLGKFGYGCQASPDGRLVAVGVGNGTNYIFDTSGFQPVLTFPSAPARWGFHAFGLEQRIVISVLDDGTLQFYDLARKQPLGRWQVMSDDSDAPFPPDVSTDGKRVAFGSPEALVHLWDLRTRTPLRSLKGHRQSVWRVSFAPDGRRLASVGNEGTVKIWDMDLHQVVLALKVREPEAGNLQVGGVYFLPDGDTMVTADSAGTLRFWRAATWEEIEQVEKEGENTP